MAVRGVRAELRVDSRWGIGVATPYQRLRQRLAHALLGKASAAAGPDRSAVAASTGSGEKSDQTSQRSQTSEDGESSELAMLLESDVLEDADRFRRFQGYRDSLGILKLARGVSVAVATAAVPVCGSVLYALSRDDIDIRIRIALLLALIMVLGAVIVAVTVLVLPIWCRLWRSLATSNSPRCPHGCPAQQEPGQQPSGED
jgi:hypothetical protein